MSVPIHMIPRQGHKKSRNGCARCKQRRVKCDERKPCSNCVRRKEECDLMFPRVGNKCPSCVAKDLQTAYFQTPLPSEGSPSTGEDPSDQKVIEWNRDMFLMHWYTRHTACSTTSDPALQKLWTEFTPQIAINFPMLTQGMLTIAALHLAHRRPEESSIWLPLSFRHQSAAIVAFREAIPTINEHNCEALFALASIISIASMAWASRLGIEEDLTVQDVIEPFYLTRGVGEVVGVAAEWIRNGPMGCLLCGHTVEADNVELPADTLHDFSRFRDLIRHSCSDEGICNTLLEDFSLVEMIYHEAMYKGSELQDEFGAIWKFAAISSPEYIALLREDNPFALLIFARFAILSSALKGKWCLDGWPQRSLRAICKTIGPQWSEWLNWPEQQLRAGLSILPRHQYMEIDPSLQ